MPTALVTGASAGIGLAFARRLAADGYDLVLVARAPDRLDATATQLTAASGARCEVLPADLADRMDLQRVADRLADPARPVDLLVNNAGFAIHSGLVRSEIADQERLLDVHCRAVLVLTHAAGRTMCARGRGAVVNVSSVAGLLAAGTYSAAKAWVMTFSEAAAVELGRKGVTVTVLCPGFVRTDLVGAALTARLPALAWVDADRLVARCLDDVRRGKAVSIPTARYAVTAAVLRHLPRPVVRALSGSSRRHRSRR
jgi:uncharacterized protein